jgi:hypothetical protein
VLVIDNIFKHGKIDSSTQSSLKWLWEKRQGIHLFLLRKAEYGNYIDNDYNRAVETVGAFVRQLRENP